MAFCENCKGLGCLECNAGDVKSKWSGADCDPKHDVQRATQHALDTVGMAALPTNHITLLEPGSLREWYDRAVRQVAANEKIADLRHRRRVYYINRRMLVELLNGMTGKYVQMPEFPWIPEGAVVIDVRDDWERHALALVVAHASFEVVPDGAEAPTYPAMTAETITFRNTIWERLPASGQSDEDRRIDEFCQNLAKSMKEYGPAKITHISHTSDITDPERYGDTVIDKRLDGTTVVVDVGQCNPQHTARRLVEWDESKPESG